MLLNAVFALLTALIILYALSAMPGNPYLPKGKRATPNVKSSDLPYVASTLQGKATRL